MGSFHALKPSSGQESRVLGRSAVMLLSLSGGFKSGGRLRTLILRAIRMSSLHVGET
jgi:hypothetical protein